MVNQAGGHHSVAQNDWDLSAEEYSAFASQNRFYRYTAETMVQMAQIEPGMVVVDLACGTGSVTEAILRQPYGKAVKIIAIDSSAQMIARAQKRFDSANVEFYCEKAENVARIGPATTDRILCNAAFWMFDKVKVLWWIAQIFKPSGKCLMGLRRRFELSNICLPFRKNTVFDMILKEKAIRGYVSGKWYDGTSRRPQSDRELETTCALAFVEQYNLKVTRRERIAVDCAPEEHIAFLRIPVMAKGSSLFAGVPDETAKEILDVVQNQLQSTEVSAPPVPWQICVLEVGG